MNVPTWVNDYIAYWKPLLFLQEWTIKVQVVDKLEHDDDFACIVETDHVYLRAKIKILDTVPQGPDDEWRKNILHELVHIRMGKLNEFMRECFFNGFSTREASFLNERLRVEDENVTVLLTEALYNLDEKRNLNIPPGAKVLNLAVKKEYEGDPDPLLVHPGSEGETVWLTAEEEEPPLTAKQVIQEIMSRKTEPFVVTKTDEVMEEIANLPEVAEMKDGDSAIYIKRDGMPAVKWRGFDDKNAPIPLPGDMATQVRQWEENLKKSMESDNEPSA